MGSDFEALCESDDNGRQAQADETSDPSAATVTSAEKNHEGVSAANGEALEPGDEKKLAESKEAAKEEDVPPVYYWQLFKFADKWDILLMIVGSVCAVGLGMAMPMISLLFGESLKFLYLAIGAAVAAYLASFRFCPTVFANLLSLRSLASVSRSTTTPLPSLLLSSSLSSREMACWMTTGERQAARVRRRYLAAVLRQDMAYFDRRLSTGEVIGHMSGDIVLVQDAMGEKVGIFLRFMAQFVGGFVVAFIAGWQLTLVMLAVLPLLAAAGAAMTVIVSKSSNKGQEAYAAAGTIVEECVSAIRTVSARPLSRPLPLSPSCFPYSSFPLARPPSVLRLFPPPLLPLFLPALALSLSLFPALSHPSMLPHLPHVAAFTGEHRAVQQYTVKLNKAFREGMKQSVGAAAGIGFTVLIMFSSYALALWYGSKLIADASYTGGDVFTVLFGVLIGGMSLGQAAPNVSAFASGQAAAGKIFEVLERQPVIDSGSAEGERPAACEGALELREVTFAYPSRPDVPIFQSFSLEVPAGRTMALVGESGSGKSTVVALVERFYDPQSGAVLLDGRSIAALNLRWLRQHMGLVSQEPALFGTSIRQNIAYGKEGATDEEIREAARLAKIHHFISSLPNGYETQVGERGTQLSGGQKQRVAIARAILRNPRVLLLDEATSALDAESEQAVQAALDALMGARTTLVVAHRLSTVRRAYCIAVLQRGQVVQTGTHAALLAQPEGAYAQLVRLQQLADPGQGEGEEGGDEKGEAVVNREGKEGVTSSALQTVAENGKAAGARVAPVEGASTVDGEGVGGMKKAGGDEEDGLMSEGRDVESGAGEKQGEKAGSGGFFSSLLRKRKGGNGERKAGKAGEEGEGGDGEEGEEKKKVAFKDTPMARLAMLNRPEWPYAILGSVAAAAHGVIMPFFALILSNIITTFYNPDISQMRSDANFWAGMFVVLGASACAAIACQTVLFGVVGYSLIRRVRALCFSSVLRQEIGWFDMDENSSGAIGARLSTDAAQVRGMVGDQMALMVQNLATVILGLVLAFRANWQLSLVILAIVPLLAITGAAQMQSLKGFSEDAKVKFEEASRVANDAVGAMRTVAAFGAEQRVQELYNERCSTPIRAGIRKAHVSGIGMAVAQFSIFGVYSLAFWFGGKLVQQGKTTFQDVFQVFFAIVFTATGIAQAAALAPDMPTVQAAVNSIFRILDRQSKIDPEAGGEEPEEVLGEVQFHAVCFAYPARPNIPILTDFNLTVPSGQTVAVVGESGSGKSTVVALVERFYDPQSGAVLLDGRSIAALNLRWLRQHMGLVSQEPALFNISIRDNIAYGRAGSGGASGGEISEAEIVEAARAANVHGFISGLPQGYATLVGERGVQISGGQKQRIAIARAIIGDPRLLLLDEATSALDAESEKVVQTALEKVMKNRTTIVVAHRLSTIKDADCIVVMQKGVVVEQGKHDELMAGGGVYSSLVSIK
ncbi:unnamed protein product [Closterium sp. Naga37s-1]|nr:unnamed protein product [Closterium sp. Naga37s-1]